MQGLAQVWQQQPRAAGPRSVGAHIWRHRVEFWTAVVSLVQWPAFPTNKTQVIVAVVAFAPVLRLEEHQRARAPLAQLAPGWEMLPPGEGSQSP
jgi:Flp pilus assembly protein TadB